jgi:hypothetical protein
MLSAVIVFILNGVLKKIKVPFFSLCFLFLLFHCLTDTSVRENLSGRKVFGFIFRSGGTLNEAATAFPKTIRTPASRQAGALSHYLIKHRELRNTGSTTYMRSPRKRTGLFSAES